jgi:hypothetical protein
VNSNANCCVCAESHCLRRRNSRRKAASRAQSLVMEVLADSRGLVKVVHQLRGNTNGLARHVRRGQTKARAVERERHNEPANGGSRRKR